MLKIEKIFKFADNLDKKVNYKIAIGIALVLYLYLFISSAYVCDDAFITFRTVENFVNGYGLTWNVSERVQVYTHPLWMFAISGIYSITSELFYSTIIFSLLLNALIFVLLFRTFKKNKVPLWKYFSLIILLIFCKAFFDYTTSGLGNILSYLFIVILFIKVFFGNKKLQDFNKLDCFQISFLGALAAFNRLDTFGFYIPFILYLFYINVKNKQFSSILLLVLGLFPIVFWEMFSLLYYGVLFPNTAYAKAFTNLSYTEKILSGLGYVYNSFFFDLPILIVSIVSIYLIIKKRNIADFLILFGVMIYVFYIILSAGSATHMSGRFLSIPYLVLILMFIKNIDNRKIAYIAFLMIIAFNLIVPWSNLKFHTPLYHTCQTKCGVQLLDLKFYPIQEHTNLISHLKSNGLIDNAWYKEGVEFQKSDYHISVGGADHGELAIGYYGFAAKEEKFIIDVLGLSDPLLARLPSCNTNGEFLRGHYMRFIPDGYIESIYGNDALLLDKDLNEYYKIIRILTRDDIFSKERLQLIIPFNLGKYDHLKKSYEEYIKHEYSDCSCINDVYKQMGLL